MASVMVSPRTTSPPTTVAPATWHSSRSPSISSVAQVVGRSAGATRPSRIAVGTAPIAATSARFCAAALRPTSYAVDQSRRKCRFSISTSVVATTRPSGAFTTAASSPGPRSTASVSGTRAVSSLMSPNSPSSPTVPCICRPPGRARSGAYVLRSRRLARSVRPPKAQRSPLPGPPGGSVVISLP